MFNATEIQLLRKRSPDKLAELLNKLSINDLDLTEKDEIRFASDLDNRITFELSRLMKSDSVIGGYIELLKLGNVAFEYSETDNELLCKIISEREAIKEGALHPPLGQAKPSDNTVVKMKDDFSHVRCALWSKKHGASLRKFQISMESSITQPALEEKIKTVICEYWQEHEETDIKSIDIVLNLIARREDTTNKESQPLNRTEVEKTFPSFTPDEIEEVLKTLEIVNNAIRAIDS